METFATSNEQTKQKEKVADEQTPREIELEKLEKDVQVCHRDHMAAEKVYVKAGENLNGCYAKAVQARKKLAHLKSGE